MSEHVHDCPTPGCEAYTVCRSPCFEPQESECIDCLRAKVRRLEERRIEERNGAFTEGTLVMGDRIRENILPPFRELFEWADNWLPDEAKDQGARDVLRRCKAVLDPKSSV